MNQNRNKLIDLLVGNVSNVIVHKILEKAINNPEIAEHYNKELLNSFEIAKRYRDKINPINDSLPLKDIEYIRNKIKNKVKSELLIRIGYKDIDLNLIEPFIGEALNQLKII